MQRALTIIVLVFASLFSIAQPPGVTSWLQNTTGIKGRHYVKNNYTPINDTDSANVQTVLYTSNPTPTNNWVYIRTKGIPSYITGPYLDGNPSNATTRDAIFKLPLNPAQNTSGTYTSTTGGNIGLFINGVALFDYRDGVSWKSSSSSLCGGPIQPPCAGDGKWNRDAVVGERLGFDCSKGHPAMGNYHHHQNPSAFKLDLNVISTVCDLYLSDGLYVLDSNIHSPLIGFAYDGFPIYGAFGYKNADGTGGITRIKSSYVKRDISTRTTWADGTSVLAGPDVSSTFPLGYFREDYKYIPTSSTTPDFLDDHNGRFCVTPEYPAGIYCYFATVDSNWNSAYPYVVGPTFYGVKSAIKVPSITEPVTVYTSTLPINLISFKGFVEGSRNILKWVTSKEVNNSHFEIESSSDALHFTKIGRVKGGGTTSSEQQYAFTDFNPSKRNSFYRLKQYDLDGKFHYSNIISIGGKGLGIKVFPNPSADLIVLQTGDILKHDLQVTLTNMQGQIVLKKEFYQGATICFLETTTVYDGAYILTINDNGVRSTYKVEVKR